MKALGIYYLGRIQSAQEILDLLKYWDNKETSVEEMIRRVEENIKYEQKQLKEIKGEY